jgi:hypothetical protein
MKDSDRPVAHLLIVQVGGIAERVKGQISGEFRVGRPMQATEARKTRMA